MSTTSAAADFTLPALDLRALARRAAIPAVLAAAAAGALVFAGGPAQAFADALARAVDADPRWVAAAAVFEILSFAGYVLLLWLVGRRATPRMDLSASTQITLGAAAATRLLPTGGVGGVALTVWSLRRAGLAPRDAARTLLVFLVLLYAVFLGAIAGAGTLLVLTGEGPLALTALPAGLAFLAIALGLVAAARTWRGSGRIHTSAAVLREAVREALGLLRRPDPRLLGALAWWTFDAAVLFAMLDAFGAPPAFAVVVLSYFVGQVGNTIPIPGAVSGGMVGVLLAFGVEADLALVSVLAYRSVAIWLPAPAGLLALRGLRRTLAGWKAQDAPAPAPRSTPTPARKRGDERLLPRRPELVAA
jgi:uncharacterized membrane protein YbhN (UPF0104 family)